MPKHVYISSSIQEWNTYFGGGTEEQHMQPIGNRVAAILWEHGFLVSTNNPTMTLQEVVAESNSLKVDLHVAAHSNAGGGEGTEVFCWPGGTRSEGLANFLYEEVAPLSPGKDRGIKDGRHLLEIKGTEATAALIEVEFHDNEAGAKWIAENHEALAVAIARAICRFYGVPFRVPKTQSIAEARLIVRNQEIPGGAILIDGKSYVWSRGFAEALGHAIRWDAATRTVYVDSEPLLPHLDRYGDHDVITCKPSQVIPAMVRGILKQDGINGGYLDGNLNPLGIVMIDGRVISERVDRIPPRTCLIITKDDQARIAKVDKVADVPDAKHILGAGPALLPDVAQDEGFQPDVIAESIGGKPNARPRTAVGIMPDGTLKLITTGSKTLKQLSGITGQLGCTQAVNMDGGGSTTMRFGGKLIRGGGRAISTAIVLREGV